MPNHLTRGATRPTRTASTSQGAFSYEYRSSDSSDKARSPHIPKHRIQSAQFDDPLPTLRFEIVEASRILRMSRAQLYKRIKSGTISAQKDGARTYITRVELNRYVDRCKLIGDGRP
jgi:transcriptional regulator of acetoin/glycerol metabolism